MKINPKYEEQLRKGMSFLGKAVESLIGQAKKAKVSVSQVKGVEPIIAIEGQLSIAKMKELIESIVGRTVKTLIPNLIDKTSLEIGEGGVKNGPLLKEKGSTVVIHADIGSGSYSAEARTKGIHSVRTASKSIPFENGFFDFVVADLANQGAGDTTKVIQEIGRLMTLGGNAIIVDFHPFGRFAKRGSVRLRSVESVIRGVEDYYKICNSSGFEIKFIKESFFDETVRSHFETPEEKSAFRSVKDTPFLIFLMITKKK